jgi:hypothetical protein
LKQIGISGNLPQRSQNFHGLVDWLQVAGAASVVVLADQ